MHTKTFSRTIFSHALWIAAAHLAACSAAPDSDGGGFVGPDDDPVASTQQPVQWAYAHMYTFDVRAFKQRIEGVIRYPWLSDGTAFASCGATFISPHFAITAAHCVPKEKFVIDNNDTYNSGDAVFMVQQVSVDGLWDRLQAGDAAATNAFVNHLKVTGTWPNYTQTTKMNCGHGYCLTGLNALCRVRMRCSTRFGNENCPSSITSRNNGQGVDIALIHCADRPQLSPYGTVYPGTDSVGQTIDVHWYHELAMLSTQPNDGLTPVGNFDHYARYDQTDTGAFGKTNNYHYRKGASLQFFPLVSRSFSNGHLYKNVALDAQSQDIMWTDAFGCHGTSGSGVFPSGTDYRVFGPVVLGGTAMSGRLCADPSKITEGVSAVMGYVRPSITRILETFVLGDR